MENTQPNINLDNFVKSYQKNLKELRENFHPEKLTAQEREELSKQIEELIALALTAKALYD